MKDKYLKVIYDALEGLGIDESFSKPNFIEKHRGYYDYFQDRSFSAMLCNIKKLFPDRTFKTIKKHIVRTK